MPSESPTPMEEFSEIVGDRSVHGAGDLQNESRRIDALGERWFRAEITSTRRHHQRSSFDRLSRITSITLWTPSIRWRCSESGSIANAS